MLLVVNALFFGCKDLRGIVVLQQNQFFFLLFQIYSPSSLIVVISWVSFWFNRGASVARVNLGVTTVLTMTTLIASTNAALPKVSYVKSIDVYLGACFFLVFTSLLGNYSLNFWN